MWKHMMQAAEDFIACKLLRNSLKLREDGFSVDGLSSRSSQGLRVPDAPPNTMLTASTTHKQRKTAHEYTGREKVLIDAWREAKGGSGKSALAHSS